MNLVTLYMQQFLPAGAVPWDGLLAEAALDTSWLAIGGFIIALGLGWFADRKKNE